MSTNLKSTFWDTLYLLALSLFFLLWDLGKGSLASWDEAIYATVAKEIISSGDWFRLTLNGSLWFDKPPLGIWATAFFYKIFGISEFSARLFSALCGTGAVLVAYFLGRKLLGRWAAFLGALVLLSSSHFIHFARFGMMDSPLCFFLSLGLYFFWLGRERNRHLIFSGLAIGLAVMAKGFAAFLIFPVIWIYCLWAGEWDVLTRSSYWIGVMLAVAVALPWNLYELVFYREAFWRDVVIRNFFVRSGQVLDGHAGNYYFYIRTLVNKYHPWVLVGIWSAPFFLFKAIRERDPELIFLCSWMFVIFVALTVVRTKIHWYLLPVYPALSLTVGYFLAKMFSQDYRHFIRFCFVIGMALHVPYSHIFDHDYSRDIKGIIPVVREKAPQKELIYLYNYHEMPAVSFYLGKKSAYLDDVRTFLDTARKDAGGFACLIHDRDWKELLPSARRLGVSVAGTFENLHLVAVASKAAS